MTHIENTRELHAEIRRLQDVAKDQEQRLKNDFLEAKEALKPENIILNLVSSVLGIKMEGKEFFRDNIMQGVYTLFQRMVLKTEKKVEDGIYSFIDELVEKIRKFLHRFVSHEAKREARQEEREDSVPGG